jgi:AcrR family transcriptional regulator
VARRRQRTREEADVPVTGVPAARVADWHPRRLEAVDAELPAGVTPPGTGGRILRAALRLFSEHGFGGTSVRQIAAEVGINPATLYAHYPSKERILAELVLLGHQELDRRLRAALSSAPPGPAARLAALVREHALIHCDYPLLAVVANTELHALTARAADPALELRAGCRRLLADVLAAGLAAGDFDLIDPDLTAIAIGGLGMQIAHWFAPGGPFTPDQVADAYAQLALRMAGAAAAGAADAERG